MSKRNQKIILLVLIVIVVGYILMFLGAGLKEEIEQVKAYNSYNEKPTNLIYFTGIGCPHCAKVSPVLLEYKTRNSNIMVIEYEIYQSRENAPIILEYQTKYNSGIGVPMLIVNKDNIINGAGNILVSLNEMIDKHQGNNILLPNADVSLQDLNLADLKGKPRIWYKDRVAIRGQNSQASEEIKAFLLEGKIPDGSAMLKHIPKPVEISGGEVEFKNERYFEGWTLRWG